MDELNKISQLMVKLENFGPRPIGSNNIINAANFIKNFFCKINYI